MFRLMKVTAVGIGVLCLELAASSDTRRVVSGIVVGSNGEPLAGAVVQVKNPVSHRVRSYITSRRGCYHFAKLDSYGEYELKADYNGLWSKTKEISQFDVRSNIIVPLRVQTPESPRRTGERIARAELQWRASQCTAEE